MYKKNTIHLLNVLFMIIVSSFMLTSSSIVISPKGKELSDYIPSESTNYANEHFRNSFEIIEDFSSNLRIDKKLLDQGFLGKPFIIYNYDEYRQDEIYYYPILNMSNEVVYMFTVMGRVDGWSHSISEEMVDELNDIDYFNNEFIYYMSENRLVAESQSEVRVLRGSRESSNIDFESKTFYQKKEIIVNSIDKLIKTDVLSAKYIETSNDKYIPSFSENTSNSKTLALHNNKGQGNYALCWAAAVSTIANYRNGTNIVPTQIADRLGIGYNQGASIGIAQLALQYYDVYYPNLIYAQMALSKIRLNISNKYPIYIRAVSINHVNGHAVTIYGYRQISLTDYVVIWDSGINSGSGGLHVVAYSSSGTTFPYANSTWTWQRTLSKYN